MFEGFTVDRVDTGEAILSVRHGGSGPPVVLLHGHPRTHATWHRVAPCWRATIPWSARTYAAMVRPPSRQRPPTMSRTRSAPWPLTASP